MEHLYCKVDLFEDNFKEVNDDPPDEKPQRKDKGWFCSESLFCDTSKPDKIYTIIHKNRI